MKFQQLRRVVDLFKNIYAEVSWADACKNGRSDIISSKIFAGENIDQFIIDEGPERGVTGLMIAASEGQVDAVEVLIDYAASINIQSQATQSTALMFACQKGHVDIVKILLQNGAKVRLINNTGHSADSFATEEIKDLLKAAILANHFINNRLINEISSVWKELFIAKIAQHIVTNSDIDLCSRFYEYCTNNNLEINTEISEILEVYQPLPPGQLDCLGHIRDCDSDQTL